jgi:hypothetical protein
MGFWIFMLIMELFVPAIMIIFGNIYRNKAPEDINGSNGYKTAMSRLNRDTWEFAHHYCAKVWRLVGWILLVPSIAAMLYVRGKDTEAVGHFGLILTLVQTVILIISIAPTEIALRKTFDENGQRK